MSAANEAADFDPDAVSVEFLDDVVGDGRTTVVGWWSPSQRTIVGSDIGNVQRSLRWLRFVHNQDPASGRIGTHAVCQLDGVASSVVSLS